MHSHGIMRPIYLAYIHNLFHKDDVFFSYKFTLNTCLVFKNLNLLIFLFLLYEIIIYILLLIVNCAYYNAIIIIYIKKIC